MVYISSNAMTSSMRTSLLSAQKTLSTDQAEIASGTYADLGNQLGSTSGKLVSLSQESDRLAAYTTSNSFANTRLSSTASTLSSLQSAATSFLTNLTAATTAGGSISGLQETASSNLTALIAGMNTTVGGEAIFGGINTGQAPLTTYEAGSSTKAAVDGAFQSNFGTSQTSSDASSVTADQMTSFLSGDFADLFSASSFTTTWSTASDTTISSEIAPGQTMSTSVSANADPIRQLAQAYTMVTEFTGSTISDATKQAVIQSAIGVVRQAVSGLTDMQTTVGAVQNSISAANDQITAQTNVLTTQTSNMHDVDPYVLDSQITNLQTQIQASYELTAQLKQLSLTNYLS